MDRPSKRPRLSIFEGSPSGSELDIARNNNDLTLKNRFESIFAKYSQDFTGIGDEIDIVTGEVVVNNGHLESMETETDPGIDHLSSDFASTGRSMLRAMTVALNPDLPGPDDVLMSIETIAANAALADDVLMDESEDTLFGSAGSASESRSRSGTGGTEESQADESLEPYNSETDSLFDGDRQRSSSVDSLFEQNNPESANDSPFDNMSAEITNPTLPLTSSRIGDDDIIARYGPYVGKEVLQLIDQRKDAHIEPAWRIPVRLGASTAQRSTSRSTPLRTSSPSMETSPAGRLNQSLWTIPKPRKRKSRPEDDQSRYVRDESIDPLQEDCSSEIEVDHEAHTAENSAQADVETEFEDDSIEGILAQASATGACPYCHSHFGTKSGVMAHWDRCLRQPQKRLKEDDPHNFDLMTKIRSTARIRVRLPRLVVYDFRTLVELHEGAGMSFDEISRSKVLRTRKTGLQLQEIYNKHRTPPTWKDSSSQSRDWTATEEENLQRLCKNPLITLATLRRGLKTRTELEIGNHLANMWLMQLGTTARSQNTLVASEQPMSARIKIEASEDELFTDS